MSGLPSQAYTVSLRGSVVCWDAVTSLLEHGLLTSSVKILASVNK